MMRYLFPVSFYITNFAPLLSLLWHLHHINYVLKLLNLFLFFSIYDSKLNILFYLYES